MVGVGQGDGVDALVHLHILMGVGADGLQAVLHRQPHVGGADAVGGFLGEAADDHVLPLAGEAAAAAEFGELEGVLACLEVRDLLVQLLFCRGAQGCVVVLHAEVDLVDNLQQVDLELHGGEERAAYGNVQVTAHAQADIHIIADGPPQAQELHIVALDEADGAQIVQLRFGEGQRAEVVDLRVDFVEHVLGEGHIRVAAAEVVLAAEIGMLVEDDLIHVEFVQVCVQQGGDDRLKLHSGVLLLQVSQQRDQAPADGCACACRRAPGGRCARLRPRRRCRRDGCNRESAGR